MTFRNSMINDLLNKARSDLTFTAAYELARNIPKQIRAAQGFPSMEGWAKHFISTRMKRRRIRREVDDRGGCNPHNEARRRILDLFHKIVEDDPKILKQARQAAGMRDRRPIKIIFRPVRNEKEVTEPYETGFKAVSGGRWRPFIASTRELKIPAVWVLKRIGATRLCLAAQRAAGNKLMLDDRLTLDRIEKGRMLAALKPVSRRLPIEDYRMAEAERDDAIRAIIRRNGQPSQPHPGIAEIDRRIRAADERREVEVNAEFEGLDHSWLFTD